MKAETGDELRRCLEEYQARDDAWLLENCRKVSGKRRMAIYKLLVERGYKAEDIEKADRR